MTRCNTCTSDPVVRCGRCRVPLCAAHAPVGAARCTNCEADWREEAPTRRSAKLIFAPPVAILSGGLLLGLLLPLAAPGILVAFALVPFAALASAGVACRVVDRGARAMFLREHGGTLPAARMLPPRT